MAQEMSTSVVTPTVGMDGSLRDCLPSGREGEVEMAETLTVGYTSTARSSALRYRPQRALSAADLIARSVQLLDSYKPSMTTVDAHADDCIQKWKLQVEDDALFLKQVLYGCVRYKQLISTLINSLYHTQAGYLQRSDIPMYRIFAYLALIRLKELTFPQFRRLCMSQEALKMIVFIRFVFDHDTLNKWCRDEWLTLYEPKFVTNLISDAASWKAKAAVLIRRLDKRAILKKKAEEEEAVAFSHRGQSKPTTVQPFNLSTPKPKSSPASFEDESVKWQFKIKPVPAVKPRPTTEEKALEIAKQINRQKIKEKYADPRFQPFRLRTLERPTNIEKLRLEVEGQREKDHEFIPPRARPVPSSPTNQVRHTTSTILREDALYKRRMEEEAKIVRAYEMELRDATEYVARMEEEKQKAEKQRLEELRKRKEELFAIPQAIAESMAEKLQEKKEAALEMKAEAERLEALKAKKELEIQSNKRAKCETIIEDRKNIKVAQDKIYDEKRKKAELIAAETQASEQRMAEERAAEQLRREDVIRQLKAIDAVPFPDPAKLFDPYTTAGYGLLVEMPLAEVRERLAIGRDKQKEWEEAQRRTISAKKIERENFLRLKANELSHIRDKAHVRRIIKREAVQRELQEKKQKKQLDREESMLELYDKLQKKRVAQFAEKERLRLEEKAIRFEQRKLAQTKDLVENMKFREVEKGAERYAVTRKQEAQVMEELYEKRKEKAEAMHHQLAVEKAKELAFICKTYDKKVEAARVLRDMEHNMEMTYKTNRIADEMTRKQTFRQKQTVVKPYTAAMAAPMSERFTVANQTERTAVAV